MCSDIIHLFCSSRPTVNSYLCVALIISILHEYYFVFLFHSTFSIVKIMLNQLKILRQKKKLSQLLVLSLYNKKLTAQLILFIFYSATHWNCMRCNLWVPPPPPFEYLSKDSAVWIADGFRLLKKCWIYSWVFLGRSETNAVKQHPDWNELAEVLPVPCRKHHLCSRDRECVSTRV